MKALPMLDHMMLWVARGFSLLFVAGAWDTRVVFMHSAGEGGSTVGYFLPWWQSPSHLMPVQIGMMAHSVVTVIALWLLRWSWIRQSLFLLTAGGLIYYGSTMDLHLTALRPGTLIFPLGFVAILWASVTYGTPISVSETPPIPGQV